MSYASYAIDCPHCGETLYVGVRDKGPSTCIGGALLNESYYIEPGSGAPSKLLDIVCKSCGAELTINAAPSKSDARTATGAMLHLERSTCGALTIKHLGSASPGIVNFSQLYPTPPNSDVHGNIPLPSGGEIRVFNACVGDIYLVTHIDPPIQVINETQTGYFSVSRRLHNEPGFTKTAHIWGKAIVAQHPHLHNAVTYDIAHPGDRIHLTYHAFGRYLLDKNVLSVEELTQMPLDAQYQAFLDAVKDEAE